MTDRYQRFATSKPGKAVTKRLGLPAPAPLRRYEPGQPLLDGAVLLGAAPGGRLAGALADVLGAVGAPTFVPPDDDLREVATGAGARTCAFSPDEGGGQRFAALAVDATGIADTAELPEASSFFPPGI